MLDVPPPSSHAQAVVAAPRGLGEDQHGAVVHPRGLAGGPDAGAVVGHAQEGHDAGGADEDAGAQPALVEARARARGGREGGEALVVGVAFAVRVDVGLREDMDLRSITNEFWLPEL